VLAVGQDAFLVSVVVLDVSAVLAVHRAVLSVGVQQVRVLAANVPQVSAAEVFAVGVFALEAFAEVVRVRGVAVMAVSAVEACAVGVFVRPVGVVEACVLLADVVVLHVC